MSGTPPVQSELPLVDIRYGVSSGTFAYEGSYPSEEMLPFDPAGAMGIRFEMDGVEYMIDGDLGGQAVYHRIADPSTLYHMPWTTFAECVTNKTLILRDMSCMSD